MKKANPLPNGRTDWLFSLPYSYIICIYPLPCGEAPSLRMQASSPEESLHLQYILPAFPYNPLRNLFYAGIASSGKTGRAQEYP